MKKRKSQNKSAEGGSRKVTTNKVESNTKHKVAPPTEPVSANEELKKPQYRKSIDMLAVKW